MKKNIFFILALIAVLISSCSKKNAERILQTIPQNTQYIAIMNGENLKSDLGQEGAARLQDLLAQPSRDASNKITSYICSEDSEVDFSTPLCIFEFNNATIATMLLKDGGKFRSGLEEKLGTKFENEKDMYYLPDNNVFVKDDQAWVLSGYPEVKASDVNSFTNLPKKSSLADNEYVAEMAGEDSDIAVLTDIKGLLLSNGGMAANLWLNMAFQSPRYLAAYVDFEKGEIVGDLTILNDKYEPASFSLRPSKIDVGALRKFNGRGNLFVAAAFDSSTIGSIVGQIKNFSPLPPEIVAALENIDGTIAMTSYISSQSQQPEQIGAMITLKDNVSASNLASYLNNMMRDPDEMTQCQAEGNTMIMYSPGQQGQPISDVAGDFDGASMGLVFNTAGLAQGDNQFANAISGIVVRLVDNGDSSNLKFKIATKEAKNSLVTLLQFMNSSN